MKSQRRFKESNLQPVTRVGGQKHTAEHQEEAQRIFLRHLEGEQGEEGGPELVKSRAGHERGSDGVGGGC